MAHRFIMSVIKADGKINTSLSKEKRFHLIKWSYPGLPSAEYMAKRFWIWDFGKFLKGENESKSNRPLRR
jgi:hypothetical protein